jgi:hypothetical protein
LLQGQLDLELHGHLVAQLERAEEAGVGRDAEVGLPDLDAAPVAARRGAGDLEPDRLGRATQGERALDRPAALRVEDHPGRGEGARRRRAQDPARGALDVAAIPVGERLGAAGALPDGQRAEVELGGHARRRDVPATGVRHRDPSRPLGDLDRQVVPHPGGQPDPPGLDEYPAGRRAEVVCSRYASHASTVRGSGRPEGRGGRPSPSPLRRTSSLPANSNRHWSWWRTMSCTPWCPSMPARPPSPPRPWR